MREVWVMKSDLHMYSMLNGEKVWMIMDDLRGLDENRYGQEVTGM